MATKKMVTKKKAFRRFADGGETVDYTDGRSEDLTDKTNRRENERNANASDDPIAAMNQMEGWTATEGRNANIDDATRQRAMDAVKAMPRRPVSKTPAPAPVAGAGRGTQGGASAKQLAEQRASDNRRALNASESYKRTDTSRPAEEEGLENLSGDFIGGPAKLGATALAGLAAGMGLKRLLKSGAKAGAEQMVKRGSPELGYEATKRIGMESGKKALPAPPRALPGPARAADVEDVVAKSAGRDDVLNPLAWLMGKKGVLGKKNGGAIKAKTFAKGGTVTASRRADGIASKGKTRGKIY